MLKSSVAVALVLSLGTEALVPRAESCCFHLTASGGESGEVGQLFDGQNRIHGNYPEGEYCIDAEGAITDGEGRGCILTPPTTQFQCDTGATPTPGFSVNQEGNLVYSDTTEMWACATGDQGSYNIYTEPVDEEACVEITLAADECKGEGAPEGEGEGEGAGPTEGGEGEGAGEGPTTTEHCPAELSGPFEFPHLIVPVSSMHPDQIYGNTFSPKISDEFSTLFNFDIPPSDEGKTCTLVFLFPEETQLETSSFTFSGSGAIDVKELSGNALDTTTFDNMPEVETDFGVTTVAPGNEYPIHSFDCPAGERITFELSTVGDTELDFFQDSNPEPIGLYITKC
ncbi:MAG: hypothetical protein M1816_000554 [Peltula sp. TS41687]|nr:MAG: hypothetical protein M1816_000554 [Peltula sp. TS41687]